MVFDQHEVVKFTLAVNYHRRQGKSDADIADYFREKAAWFVKMAEHLSTGKGIPGEES